MPFCKELKKDFETKKELFTALKANVKEISGLKKAAIKFSDPVSYRIKNTNASKAEATQLSVGDTIYPVINTCWYYDSHGDVHASGIWDLSIKDQAGKLYY